MSRAVTVWIALLLATLTLAVYAPIYQADFVDYDDPLYVTENDWVKDGFTLASFKAAWTQRVAGNWHPVTMLSHLVDVSLFGLQPGGHHGHSLLIHTANVVLLWLLLRSLLGGVFRPALAAALFALHPVNVDSVAWIAERKNVLSTLFWLAATLCYVRHARRPSVVALLGTFALFALGLLAKPMLVTFPATLLLLDRWPLRRVTGFTRADWPVWHRLLQEKIPLFMLTTFFSVYTVLTQFPEGYTHSPFTQPLGARLLFALEHYRLYLQHVFWPANLCVFYPRLDLPPDTANVLASGLLILGLTGSAVALYRKVPAWTFGWFWFIGTLLPVIGIIAIGEHSIADRYLYVPMIGLLVAALWGFHPGPVASRRLRLSGYAVGLAAVFACGYLIRANLPHWYNSEALFRQAIAATDRNYIMHTNLGRTLMLQGRTEEAIAEFQTALRYEPRHAKAVNNLGLALALQGKPNDALELFTRALELEPGMTVARVNLARTLNQLGRYDEALPHFTRLHKILPRDPVIQEGLQTARQWLGRPDVWSP